MTESSLVDSHVHIFTTDMPLVDNPRHAPTYSFTTEQLLATMDAHGVAFAVIAAASPWGDYNDYTISALRAHPRLRGTVILEPTVERYILDAMARTASSACACRSSAMTCPTSPRSTTGASSAVSPISTGMCTCMSRASGSRSSSRPSKRRA